MRALALPGILVTLVFISTQSSVADSTSTSIKNAKSGQAQLAKVEKASYRRPKPKTNPSQNIVNKNAPLVFSAPPQETPEAGEQKYQPIAKYLSTVIGRKIVYKHPQTWGVYRTEMVNGKYDLIFDGPHFNSYRVQYLGHNILAKIPARHQFVVVVKKGEKRFNNVKQLAGRTFCTHAPPNLGTLTLLNEFDNPARQPVIINTKGWEKIYRGVISGKCVAGILPVLNLTKYDPKGVHVTQIFKAKKLPNQAFSAGPRITPKEQMKIAQALIAPKASAPTAALRAAYKVGKSFAPAKNREFIGVSDYLKNEWGYF